jgi:hypothetical protein
MSTGIPHTEKHSHDLLCTTAIDAASANDGATKTQAERSNEPVIELESLVHCYGDAEAGVE